MPDNYDGPLFSRLYLERGTPQSDSKRFRIRFGAMLDDTPFSRKYTADLILREIGVRVPSSGIPGRITFSYAPFVRDASLRDLLDVITLIYKSIDGQNRENARQAYISFVNRSMREENLGYRLDENGIVHFYVDEEFERSRTSLISGLSGDAHKGALEAFEAAHSALLASDTLNAVRRSFDAVENIFKLRFGVPRLGASEINKHLTPLFAQAYSGRVGHAAGRLAASFAEWANAAHQFRHAPGEAEPSPPTMDVAILMVSQAAANLRWLLELTNGK